MKPDIYIPTLHSFAMGNPFSGSWQELRFLAKPTVVMATPKEVDFEQSSITVEYWHGPLCYTKSEMEGQMTFPMSEEGRMALKVWLEEKVSY